MPKEKTFPLTAVRTKFHPPANTKGSRFSATLIVGGGRGKRVVIPSDDAFDPLENHLRAARKILGPSVQKGYLVIDETPTTYIIACKP